MTKRYIVYVWECGKGERGKGVVVASKKSEGR